MIDLINEIEYVDGNMIGSVLNAVLKRYNELFPEWEVSTISLHKCTDRNEQLDNMIMLLEKMKSYY